MLKVTLILAALAVCYASPLPAKSHVLHCTSDQVEPFDLEELPATIWINGNGLIIDRNLSDAHNLVAAIIMVDGSTSVVLGDDGTFTQTFLPGDGGAPGFIYAECK